MFGDLVEVVRGSSDDALVARFGEVEARLRAVQAELAVTVGEVHRRELHRADGHGTVGGWMRAHALLDGSLGVCQADELARVAANPRCGDQLGEVLPVLLEHATHLAYGDFKVLTTRGETLADTDGAHRSRDATHAARSASLVVTGGVLHLRAQGGAIDGAAMIEVFERFRTAEFDTDCDTAGRTAARCHGPKRNDASTRSERSSPPPPQPHPARSPPSRS